MIDALICHPKDIIYPQFMYRMNKDRNLFGRVVVVMTQTVTDRDYTDYIKSHIKDVTMVVNYPYKGLDWRQDAIVEGLFETREDRVLFLEQDFLVDDGFFKALFDKSKPYTTVGFRAGNRFHPACLLVTQDAIARTRKDFSVDPDVGDHFYKFTLDLENIGNCASLKNFDLPKFKHLSGLTQNYRLTNRFHHPKEFYNYLMESLEYDQPDDWRLFTVKKAKEVKNDE